jgi:hypothetical protein
VTAKLELRPAVRADLAILRRLDSPIIRQFGAGVDHLRKAARGKRAALPPAPAMSDEQTCEAMFVLSVSHEDAAAELQKGRDAFRECAMSKIADLYSPEEIAAVIEPMFNTYFLAFAKGLRL